MNNNTRQILATFLILPFLTCGVLFSALTQAAPKMWQITDNDSTVTLYPTVHLLPEKMQWQTPELKRVINNAQEVWFEVIPDELDQQNMSTLLAKHGYQAGSLGDSLAPGLLKKLTAYLAVNNIALTQVQTMQPWLLALTIMNIELQRNGWSAENGVEAVLRPMTQNKTVKGLETASFQITLFSTMSDAQQAMFLESTLDDTQDGAELLRDIANAWSKGDLSQLDSLLIQETKTLYPQIYDLIFTQRNLKWVAIIEQELAKSGTDFFAVGAGHLVGSDSVVQLLRDKGYKVTAVD
ncbi:MAG: TraB/GumN family protein [Glaciecola sp.]|jgi:uncharacterized protein|nr:TraB/GumN family protein [Glaciecola sp.]MDG1815640.1 TraB/GumN family protein [Glaciecola sp.]MDG2098159.1 TraB/GumN family protein [Glaciecola sp.]